MDAKSFLLSRLVCLKEDPMTENYEVGGVFNKKEKQLTEKCRTKDTMIQRFRELKYTKEWKMAHEPEVLIKGNTMKDREEEIRKRMELTWERKQNYMKEMNRTEKKNKQQV